MEVRGNLFYGSDAGCRVLSCCCIPRTVGSFVIMWHISVPVYKEFCLSFKDDGLDVIVVAGGWGRPGKCSWIVRIGWHLQVLCATVIRRHGRSSWVLVVVSSAWRKWQYGWISSGRQERVPPGKARDVVMRTKEKRKHTKIVYAVTPKLFIMVYC